MVRNCFGMLLTQNITLYLHNCLIKVENMVPVCPSLLLTIFTANYSYFMQTLKFNNLPIASFYMFYQHRHFSAFLNFKVCVNENCRHKCSLKFALNLAVFCGFFSDLSLLSATAVLLVWFNKKSSSEIRLDTSRNKQRKWDCAYSAIKIRTHLVEQSLRQS